jgi:thiopeptide-type bacteriocin biosynthesis protein
MTARYQHHGLALARSTTDPGDLDIPLDLDPADDAAVRGEGRAWLEKLWSRDDVRDALALASPALCERVTGLLADGPGPGRIRDLCRAVLSVAAYMVRWERRVTPFGLFAGILPAAAGPARALLGDRHRTIARPDARWIAALAKSLGELPGLGPYLTVIASNLAFIQDGRLVLPRHVDPAAEGPVPAREASVRWTRPVRAAIEAAQAPVRVEDLSAQLAGQFPAAAPGAIRAMVNGLIDGGFLITSLYPPSTTADPLASVAEALRDASEHGAPGTAPRLRTLVQVASQIREHNEADDPRHTARLRVGIAARMRALAPEASESHPLAIDVRLDGRLTIPDPVLDEAAAAAGVLLRLSARPFGSPTWLDYHARFCRQYGPGTLVPVTELVADSGLGYPDGYLGTPRQRPAWRMLADRDAALLAMIQRAALAGDDEITLASADIDALTTGDPESIVPPPRAEIAVSLHARSLGALDRGDFELRVVAVPPAPTSMAGRFAHLLTADERGQLRAASETGDGSLPVQLSFPPCRPRAGNVTRVPPLAGHVLALGEHPPAGAATISVDELAVTADATQMYLVHQPTGRRVDPRIPHALDLPRLTPPLARFLAEVAAARTARLGPLDLGAARVLPYVPRIRCRRTVLSPASWLLTPEDISPRSGPGDWTARLDRWRCHWKVPSRVIACDGEQRLPLDLDHPLDRALLRRELDRSTRLELREDAPPEGDGWLGRPAELLIPLTLTAPAQRPLPVTTPPGRLHRPGASPVICATITGSPARFDDIITGHLPALAGRLDGITERWWLRRHRDLIRPAAPQHIAIVIRLRDPGDFAQASAGLAEFAADLEARGLPGHLTLATYAEHPGRYGHGEAMDAAEDVFAADTTAAIAQLTMAMAGAASGQALAAASMAALAAAFAPALATGYQALTLCLEQGSGPLDRPVRDQAGRLADPAGSYAALRALPGGEATAAAWSSRDAALAAYYETLSAQRDAGTVLRTLLHEHHMRAVGLDPDFERQTGRYARAAALRRLALAGIR